MIANSKPKLSLSATLRQNSAEQKKFDREHLFFFAKLLEINRLCDNIPKDNYPLHDSGNRIQNSSSVCFPERRQGRRRGGPEGLPQGRRGGPAHPRGGGAGGQRVFPATPLLIECMDVLYNVYHEVRILYNTERIPGPYPLC